MKIKIANLIGPALDWAVATIENLPIQLDPMGVGNSSFRFWVWPNSFPPKPAYQSIGNQYSPSTKWAQGGPIIEQEKLETRIDHEGWHAVIKKRFDSVVIKTIARSSGPTPLIAAMRCFVASKLGDEIDVPEELT